MVWQIIQQGDYAFSIHLKDAYFHIPIVKHHHSFLYLFHKINIINGRFCLLAGYGP